MSNFSNNPRLRKGRIDVVETDGSKILYSIAFQFNPERLTRTLSPRWMQEGSSGANKSHALRLSNPPEETISMEIEIDSVDQPEDYPEYGIYPQLAALEVLIYPASERIKENNRLLNDGNIEIVPPEAPRTLLVWGKNRVIPVKLTNFTINEENYDLDLNPIQAKVSIGMKVLSYSDVPQNHPVSNEFMNYHQNLETMAKKARRI